MRLDIHICPMCRRKDLTGITREAPPWVGRESWRACAPTSMSVEPCGCVVDQKRWRVQAYAEWVNGLVLMEWQPLDAPTGLPLRERPLPMSPRPWIFKDQPEGSWTDEPWKWTIPGCTCDLDGGDLTNRDWSIVYCLALEHASRCPAVLTSLRLRQATDAGGPWNDEVRSRIVDSTTDRAPNVKLSRGSYGA